MKEWYAISGHLLIALGAGVVAGVMLVKSQETIGGLLAITRVISLLANGVSINLYQLLNVGAAAYSGIKRMGTAISETQMSTSPNGGGGQNVMFSGEQVRRIRGRAYWEWEAAGA